MSVPDTRSDQRRHQSPPGPALPPPRVPGRIAKGGEFIPLVHPRMKSPRLTKSTSFGHRKAVTGRICRREGGGGAGRDALEDVLDRHGKPAAFGTSKGSQFTSWEFTNARKKTRP